MATLVPSAGASDEAQPAPNCAARATARARGAPRGWSVALSPTRASALPLDSLPAMAPADSAALTDAVRTLLSTRHSASDTTFRGIPYVVTHGYRLSTATADLLVAIARRGIPSEADPREETVFVVAERRADTPGAYRIAFEQDATGTGDQMQVTDLLAALLLRDRSRPVLVISRQGEIGAAVTLLERSGAGRWRARWTRSYTEC